jgi:ATP-dependent DNA helicase RecG
MTKKYHITEDFVINITEGKDYEFKSAQGGLPKSVWETYSAFANTDGGVIFLGVENSGLVSGIDRNIIFKLQTDFWNNVNNRQKVSAMLLTNQDVREENFKDRVIVLIKVPRATRSERPVYLNSNPLTGTYRRNHEGDYHCTEEEVKRMLSDQSDESFDSQIVEEFNLDDLDQRSLKEYRYKLSSHKPTHSGLNEDDIGLLAKIGGWRDDRKNKKGLTVASILMFGKDEIIREVIPQYLVDYREKLDSSRYTDRIWSDGSWNANLFQFFEKTLRSLTSDLKLPFQLDENLMRKGISPVHEAVREALVNSLIHADYRGVGGIVIEKHPDQLIFTNPGSLLVSQEELYRKPRVSISECRNKNLQQMFTAIGASDKMGSGVDKIHAGWESQHWRTPKISENFRPDRVCWTLPMISLIPEESYSRLSKLFGFDFQQLSQPEVNALVIADTEGFVDNARMQQITNDHMADVSKMLRSLVERGFLLQEGKTRWARYRLNSLDNEGNSLDNESNSIDNESNSLDNDSELTLLLTKMKGRIKPELMEEIIKKLCSNRWLTRREIAISLKRNPEDLRNRFLNPMAAHGILELRYPETPNRPDQAYSLNIKTTKQSATS